MCSEMRRDLAWWSMKDAPQGWHLVPLKLMFLFIPRSVFAAIQETGYFLVLRMYTSLACFCLYLLLKYSCVIYYWSNMLISAVQQCDSVIRVYILFHYGLSQDIEYSSLCYVVGPSCLSILYILLCIYWPQTPNRFILFYMNSTSINYLLKG